MDQASWATGDCDDKVGFWGIHNDQMLYRLGFGYEINDEMGSAAQYFEC